MVAMKGKEEEKSCPVQRAARQAGFPLSRPKALQVPILCDSHMSDGCVHLASC